MMNAFRTEIPKAEQGLVQNLKGKHPDDAWSPVVYNKGQFLMHTLEHVFGRAALDNFLKRYFAHFKFQTITSEKFARYIDQHLFRPNKDKGFGMAELNAWLYGPGIPKPFKPPFSARLNKLEHALTAWKSGALSTPELKAKHWSTQEWVYFLGQLAPKFDRKRLAELDHVYQLSNSPNAEIGLAWLPLAIRSGYTGAQHAVERHLGSIGRNRLILPVYRALTETPAGLATARALFEQFKNRYHPQTVQAIAALLAKAEKEQMR
ncbi:MAG: hypothetical protein D6694_00135 [Gammaproteobacteria bacterium]|nr:MAG: hypothetical protein D6694_00135 [Gammaproteobacteria bacterium]